MYRYNRSAGDGDVAGGGLSLRARIGAVRRPAGGSRVDGREAYLWAWDRSDRVVGASGGRGLDLGTLVALSVTLLLWASAFPAIRASLAAYSPAHVAVFRFIFLTVSRPYG